jgi:hypothetical protein
MFSFKYFLLMQYMYGRFILLTLLKVTSI